MKRLALMIGALLLVTATALTVMLKPQPQLTYAPDKKSSARAGDDTISGPYMHNNLAVFLIHGPDKLTGKPLLTLQEAMEQKKVMVHETEQVNELAIENVSAEEVYVQAGDIVKGGKQDRVLAFDLIVPPHSGRLPIASFCVEHGRWSRRGREETMAFSVSTSQLNSKDLKIAARHRNSQREVWDKVAENQSKVSQNVRVSAGVIASSTSLQLMVDDKRVKEAIAAYSKKLASITDEKSDVIGYAFAINGQINSADVYTSRALFKKLWPKLLEASAVEAIAELQKDKKFEAPTVEAVKAGLADAESGKPAEKEVTKRITLVTRETAKNLLFETRDRERAGAWIHRNYLTK